MKTNLIHLLGISTVLVSSPNDKYPIISFLNT